ncbi:Crp/Fnr family transcriptional regulator [Neobacillus drentensis]|uniref:Crp/Fnr family transcriptional regulator n=1 Tax=Neobacillus drentensis TaxID=220684 RepID=UPI002FFD951B
MNQSLWLERGDWAHSHFSGQGKLLTFPRETLLFQQDTVHPYVYLVLEGRVRVFLLSPMGAERHLYIVGSGHLLGESAAWTEDQSEYCATASSDVQLLQITKHDFFSIILNDLALTKRVLSSLCQKQSALLLQAKLMSFSDVEQRVLTMLQQLAASYGIKTSIGLTITIPFTHQELAYVVGSSRVSVSYVMNSLQEKGEIVKQNGLYTLLTSREQTV